jgi:Tfp pilus assembly PilM family ATPase/Tfp pilus assembly protein PilN
MKTNRCIGIDVGRSYVRAAQVARTPEGLVLERTFCMPARRSTDSLPGILQSLTGTHGFDRRADVAVAMPSHAVLFAEVQTDAAGLKALQAGQTLHLRDDLPIAVEDALVRVCSIQAMPKDKYCVLVAATSGELVGEHLQPFEEARIRPVAVDASVVAVRAAIAMNHPGLAAATALTLCVDESVVTLTVTRGEDILIVRNIPIPGDLDAPSLVAEVVEIVEREVEITWRKLFGADPDGDLCIFLISPAAAAAALAAAIQDKMACRVVAADPCIHVRRLEGAADVDSPMCVAEGLALRTLAAREGDAGDFLTAYDARVRPGWTIRKELLVCAALLALTAVVWFAGLFVRLWALESRHARLKGQIETVFHQALPEENNIVDPLAQLQQKLDAFQKEYELFPSFRPGRYTPLEIMHMLTTHTPRTGGLRFHDLLITTDCIQAAGSCDSFTVLSDWQRQLKQMPSFNVVDIQSQKKDARTGQVQFTLTMSTAGAEL